MDFNRAELKQGVRLSMKGATTRPMLVTLLFTVAVSAGTWLINTVLGWMLTGGVGSISATVQQYILQGYDVDYAVHAALLELLSMGAGAIFGAVVGGSVLSILVALWQGVMNVGYEGYCLSMVRNEDPPMGKILGRCRSSSRCSSPVSSQGCLCACGGCWWPWAMGCCLWLWACWRRSPSQCF